MSNLDIRNMVKEMNNAGFAEGVENFLAAKKIDRGYVFIAHGDETEFMIGRFIEGDFAPQGPMDGDFDDFDMVAEAWQQI